MGRPLCMVESTTSPRFHSIRTPCSTCLNSFPLFNLQNQTHPRPTTNTVRPTRTLERPPPPSQLWDLKTGLAIQKFQGHTDGVTFVLPGPDGRVLTASEDRTLRVWDVETGECLRVIRSHSGAVTSLCMAGPNRIVTGCSDKKLRVFSINGHLQGETELDSEINAIASPPLPAPRRRSSRGGACGRSDSGRVSEGGGKCNMVMELFRDASDGAPLSSASSASPPAPPVVRVLACGGTHIPSPPKPMLRSVDVKTASTTDVVEDVLARPANAKSNLCAGRSEYDDDDEREAVREAGIMTCVAISAAGAKGRGILVTGSYDKGVRVLHNVLSSDRDHQPSSSSEGEEDEEENDNGSAAKAAAAAAGGAAPPVTMRLLGRHNDGVRAVAISADGRWAVSGDREGRIKVWEIPQEAPPGAQESLCLAEAEFEAHKGYVFALCMSPDARTLVSGGSDKALRVWDLSLLVYARRMGLNRLRALWTAGRLRRARPKRTSTSSNSSASSPKRSGLSGGGRNGGGGGGGPQVLKAFGGSRDQRQQILESLFALPEIIYAKILMYV